MSLLLELPVDDRLYVMGLTRGSVADIDAAGNQLTKRKRCWVLTTYKNSMKLPVVRCDHFDTYEQAKTYVMAHEPFTPLVSRSEKPMRYRQNPWKEWTAWLKAQGLQSCLDSKPPRPRWAKGGCS